MGEILSRKAGKKPCRIKGNHSIHEEKQEKDNPLMLNGLKILWGIPNKGLKPALVLCLIILAELAALGWLSRVIFNT
jgi:hypothetical protein